MATKLHQEILAKSMAYGLIRDIKKWNRAGIELAKKPTEKDFIVMAPLLFKIFNSLYKDLKENQAFHN